MNKDNTRNGHKNGWHFNVYYWLFNTEGLFNRMKWEVLNNSTLDKAAEAILFSLRECQTEDAIYCELSFDARTPDGIPYTFSNIRAALRHWDYACLRHAAGQCPFCAASISRRTE